MYKNNIVDLLIEVYSRKEIQDIFLARATTENLCFQIAERYTWKEIIEMIEKRKNNE